MKETKTEDKLYLLNTHYKTEVIDVELSQCISDSTAEVETSTVDSCIAGKDITVEHLSQVTITSKTATPLPHPPPQHVDTPQQTQDGPLQYWQRR